MISVQLTIAFGVCVCVFVIISFKMVFGGRSHLILCVRSKIVLYLSAELMYSIIKWNCHFFREKKIFGIFLESVGNGDARATNKKSTELAFREKRYRDLIFGVECFISPCSQRFGS